MHNPPSTAEASSPDNASVAKKPDTSDSEEEDDRKPAASPNPQRSDSESSNEGDQKPAAKVLDDVEDNDNETDGGSSSDSEGSSNESEDNGDDDDDDSVDNGLSDYEKLRLERIKRNQARLEQLGLASTTGAGVFGSLAPKKVARPVKRRRKPEQILLPKRSSRSRSAKKRIDYSRDIDFRRMRHSSANPASTAGPVVPKSRKPKRPRAVRWIHDEFRRLGKQRRLNVIAAKRSLRAASKELKYWRRKMDSFMQKKRKHYDTEQKQLALQKERELLGGFTKIELLREIDKRTPELQRVLIDFNVQEAKKSETEEQRLAFLERIEQQQALERKMQMIDALERFPKALKDATASLNSMLYHRSPKDPPPPRRSKRNSDAAEDVQPSESPTKKKQGPAEETTRNENSWTKMVVDTPTNAVAEKSSPARRKKEVRNVGGWISPQLAKDLDRRWLEREKAIHSFDLNRYVPQVGDTVLYYPGLHQEFLEDHPDVLGKITRNILRVPLWQRAAKERKKTKTKAEDNWWTDAWIDSPQLAMYPLICRVERTHAEFPPDPYSNYKTVNKDGTVVWQLPKGFKGGKDKPCVRLAVMLKPLTPVLPPKFDSEKGFTEPNNLRLPPKFTVATFPTDNPFLVPFVWAYALTHSIDEGDAIDIPNVDSAKAKIKKFLALDEMHGSFRLDDKVPLIQNILNSFQQPSSAEVSPQDMMEQAMSYEDSSRTFSATDAGFVVDLLQSYFDRKSLASSETNMEGTLLDIVRSTLPLGKGVEVVQNVYNRKYLWLSRWHFSARTRSRTEDIIPGLNSGLLHNVDSTLRIKIVCCIEDFIQRTEHAEIFSDEIVEDAAPGYYCAVPIAMHFERILKRLNPDKQLVCYYSSVESVLSDIQAIADNCLLYNSLDSDIALLCTEIISSVKGQVSDVFNKHVREQSNRIKAEQERRRSVLRSCEALAVKEVDAKTMGKSRAVPDWINTPYEGSLYREWMERVDPDNSWRSGANANSDLSLLDWFPQSGDIVHYSRRSHAQFVKGHIDSLAEEQCMLPRFGSASSETSADFDGNVTMENSRDELSKQLDSHWLIATVVGVRSSFPRFPEKEDSFNSPSPILSIGLRFPYSWAKGKVYYVCWRPCQFEVERMTNACSACGLGNASFLAPAWLTSSPQRSVLEGFDTAIIGAEVKPRGIDGSYLAAIAQCIDVLKRRCLNDVDADHLDPRRCIENAERGKFANAKTPSSRVLPVFKDLLSNTANAPTPKKKQTRDVSTTRIVKDQESVEMLSSMNFLPPWSRKIGQTKNGNSSVHNKLMATPSLCLELVSLRLRVGYYRQPAAVVNDIVEAYVTTVLYALAEPATRKKNRLSTRKIAKYLNSSKGNIRRVKLLEADEARRKPKADSSLASDFQSGLTEISFEDAEYEALSNEEKMWVAKVHKIRMLYAMAVLSVTDTENLQKVLGLPFSKEKKTGEYGDSVFNNGEKLREDGVRHIQYLLSAIARDPCDNAPSFRGQMQLKISCDSKVVPADRREEDDLQQSTSASSMNSIQLGFHEMEKSNDLTRVFIGQAGRRAPCVRCQVYGNSMLTCRLTLSHSNVDFAFVDFFKDAGGVDGLLRSAYVGTHAASSQSEKVTNKILDCSRAANSSKRKDPTDNLEKAQTAFRLSQILHQQAEILAQAPVTLGKDFIKTYFPVDPSDGHYVFCTICGRSGDLLCCEGCPNVVHADCIGLHDIPDGDWYCGECGKKKVGETVIAGKDNPSSQTELSSASGSNEPGKGGNETGTNGGEEDLASRTQNPYPASILFANQRRQEVEEQNPSASSHEVSKILSDMWEDASDDLKEEYKLKESKQREAYKAEVEELRKKKRDNFDKSSSYAAASAFIAQMSARHKQKQVAAQELSAPKEAVAADQGEAANVEGLTEVPVPPTLPPQTATSKNGIGGTSDIATSPGLNISAQSTSENDKSVSNGAISMQAPSPPDLATAKGSEGKMDPSAMSLSSTPGNSHTNEAKEMTDTSSPQVPIISHSDPIAGAKSENTDFTRALDEPSERPPRANAVEEVDTFDYLEEVMKRAKEASIKDCCNKCKKGVGLLIKKKNAYCHICHNRSDVAYGFACQQDTHNYCTRHVLERFDLGEGQYTLNYCPICCLNCECSACSRKVNNLAREFKQECHRQDLPGSQAKLHDVLGRCAAVSGARDSSFVAWNKEIPDSYDIDLDQVSSGYQETETAVYIEPPKKPCGAYVFFGHEMRPKIFEENPNTKFAELGKILGDRWRSCSPAERKKYEDLSAADRARYKKEMIEYEEKRREATKEHLNAADVADVDDIEVPQKPCPAYFQFANARRGEVKKAHPEASNGDVSKILSEMWRSSSDEFKAFYMQEETKQRSIYRKQMEEYERKVAARIEAAGSKTPLQLTTGHVDTSDIEPPQKPYPAYFQFANCRRLEIKAQNPGISSVEITRALSEMWRNSSDEFKATFVEEETKQRESYRIALEEYHEKIRKRYAEKGVAYPGDLAAVASSRQQAEQVEAGYSSKHLSMIRRRFPVPAISDEVFEEQTRNLESILEELQAHHPTPFSGYPTQEREKKKNPPVVPIETVIKKQFDDLGEFTGKVTGIPEGDNPYYEVEYEDGDEEELSINELLPLVSEEVRSEYNQALREYEATPPKKKRGRPRKYPPKDDGEEYVPKEFDLDRSKKKRGRPRKSQPAEGVGSDVDEPKKKRGRPRKSQPAERVGAILEEPKNKTGRPRKSQPAAEGIGSEQPTKKRGRPTLSGENPHEEPVRKRGRPRKLLESSVSREPPKKGRSRSRKSIGTVEAVPEGRGTSTERPARPRKSAEVFEALDPPKPKRGRSRKGSSPALALAVTSQPKVQSGRPPKETLPVVEPTMEAKRPGRPSLESSEGSNMPAPGRKESTALKEPEVRVDEPAAEPSMRTRRRRRLA